MVASAADDGSYRPEHHSGAYNNNGQYRAINTGKYYHGAVVPVHPIVKSYAPAVAVQPLVHIQPAVRYNPDTTYQPPYYRYQNYSPEGHWQTLRDVRHQSSNGDFSYEYETQNGIHVAEQSQMVSPVAQRRTGFYEYPSSDGRIIRVDYIADENGYRATVNGHRK